ncbi:Rnase H [Bacillus phage vB_BmeM-Goe8]|uniref:Putative 3' exoribonuclease n=1 Tax=Bacillus phage vB_BmeM-Goe8 TaxID=2593638 RepID=A0A516KMK4_9CAUD|nr:Rnase H [Bacillus phage vB_BmeM-Goe8]QDP42823.1 putative 3' exoribonuclease [Bacillus phage vB_BmeM-Goe8]
MTKIFWDFEFTGLHQYTTPISVGFKASNGKQFYAEFNDFDQDQVDDWVRDNVIAHLQFTEEDEFMFQNVGDYTCVKGTFVQVSNRFLQWLKQFDRVEFWGDCLSYDGVLLNNLFWGAHNVPENVDYIFYDICTLFKMFGIDPDISREAFIDKPINGKKHNALYDSLVIEACYEKLQRNKKLYDTKL